MNSELESSNLNDMTNMSDAESDLFDLFEEADDAVNDDIEAEEDLIVDQPEECETGTAMPVPVAETEIMEMVPVKAEVVESAPPVAIRATGSHTPYFWMPWLPYPITARGVFDLALTVSFVDPARQQLRFFYEARLKYECEKLIPHPIPSFYPQGIQNALLFRRSNPGFFVCCAIDVVLTHYLKELNGGNFNDIF